MSVSQATQHHMNSGYEHFSSQPSDRLPSMSTLLAHIQHQPSAAMSQPLLSPSNHFPHLLRGPHDMHHVSIHPTASSVAPRSPTEISSAVSATYFPPSQYHTPSAHPDTFLPSFNQDFHSHHADKTHESRSFPTTSPSKLHKAGEGFSDSRSQPDLVTAMILMGIQARSANAFPFRKKRQRSSPAQLNILEEQFLINPMPSHMARVELALRLNMTPRRVQVWFQNKRAKVRRAIRNGELVSVQLPESDGEDN